ncbi:unnamed protein product [Umbelopsis ramanniana]
MPKIEIPTPWTPNTITPVKIYGDIKNPVQVNVFNNEGVDLPSRPLHRQPSVDLYSRTLHRQPSEKLLQQRHRCLQVSEHDTRPNEATNLTRANKKNPQMSIKPPQRLPEQQQNIVCPSPKTPKFNASFLQHDFAEKPAMELTHTDHIKSLLDTGRDSSRSILGRKFPKCTDPHSIYPLPTDQAELARLDKEHGLVKELFNCIYRSPVESLLMKGIKVLDVGCGSGSWCIEMAQKYKRSHFTGIDVSLKKDASIAPNLTMLKIDMTSSLPFANETFDYVFCRNLSLAIPFDDWDRTIGDITRVAKYNAYLEFIEADWEIKRSGSALKRWNTFAIAALRNRQYNPRIGRNLDVFLRFHLSDINNTYLSMPVGEWSNTKLGLKAQQYWVETMASLKPIILGSTDPKTIGFATYERLVSLVQKEMVESQCYCNYYAYYGRKAEEVPIYFEKRPNHKKNRSQSSNRTFSASSSPPSDCSDTTDSSASLST